MPNNYKAARKAKGLTQRELGALIGVAESTVSLYEKGKRQPDNETLLRMAEELDTTVGYLLGAEPPIETKSAAPVTEDGIDADLRFMLSQLSPEETAHVRAYVQGFLAARQVRSSHQE